MLVLGTIIDDDVQFTSFRSTNVKVNDEWVDEMIGDCNVVDDHNVGVNDENFEEMSGDGNVANDQNVEVNDENVEEISGYGNVDEDYVANEDNWRYWASL